MKMRDAIWWESPAFAGLLLRGLLPRFLGGEGSIARLGLGADHSGMARTPKPLRRWQRKALAALRRAVTYPIDEVLLGIRTDAALRRATAVLGSPVLAEQWLDAPNDALGGATPRSMLSAADGRAAVYRVLGEEGVVDEETADALQEAALEASAEAVDEVRRAGLPLTVIVGHEIQRQWPDGRVEVLGMIRAPKMRLPRGTVLRFDP